MLCLPASARDPSLLGDVDALEADGALWSDALPLFSLIGAIECDEPDRDHKSELSGDDLCVPD